MKGIEFKIAQQTAKSYTDHSRNLKKNAFKTNMELTKPSMDNDYEPKLNQLVNRKNTIKGNRLSCFEKRKASTASDNADRMWEVSPFIQNSDEYNHKSR